MSLLFSIQKQLFKLSGKWQEGLLALFISVLIFALIKRYPSPFFLLAYGIGIYTFADCCYQHVQLGLKQKRYVMSVLMLFIAFLSFVFFSVITKPLKREFNLLKIEQNEIIKEIYLFVKYSVTHFSLSETELFSIVFFTCFVYFIHSFVKRWMLISVPNTLYEASATLLYVTHQRLKYFFKTRLCTLLFVFGIWWLALVCIGHPFAFSFAVFAGILALTPRIGLWVGCFSGLLYYLPFHNTILYIAAFAIAFSVLWILRLLFLEKFNLQEKVPVIWVVFLLILGFILGRVVGLALLVPIYLLAFILIQSTISSLKNSS